MPSDQSPPDFSASDVVETIETLGMAEIDPRPVMKFAGIVGCDSEANRTILELGALLKGQPVRYA